MVIFSECRAKVMDKSQLIVNVVTIQHRTCNCIWFVTVFSLCDFAYRSPFSRPFWSILAQCLGEPSQNIIAQIGIQTLFSRSTFHQNPCSGSEEQAVILYQQHTPIKSLLPKHSFTRPHLQRIIIYHRRKGTQRISWKWIKMPGKDACINLHCHRYKWPQFLSESGIS